MAEVKSPVRCVLAGSNSWPQVAEYVHRRNLDSRVTLLGYISHTDKLRLYASSLAVFYGPFDEDYGYVTLEAMLSRKPVITCTDSGGPREFVEHDRTGFVVEPDPRAIAQALDQLYAEKERARSLGEAGYDLYQSKDISWERVVEALLSA
jgi:glycosyltransferase involved in cell wall biosynthesis